MCLTSPRAFMLSKTLDVAAETEERATTAASSCDGLMSNVGYALFERAVELDRQRAGGC